MSGIDVLSLPWLPPPPEDFASAIRASAKSLTCLRRLSGHSLNANQAHALANAADQIRQREGGLKPLYPVRLAVVGETTTK